VTFSPNVFLYLSFSQHVANLLEPIIVTNHAMQSNGVSWCSETLGDDVNVVAVFEHFCERSRI